MSKFFEQTPVSDQIPFDNISNGFTADNVQDAIEEAATGGAASQNFSYKLIDVGQTVIIQDNQQMLHRGDITVLGDLRTLGDLIQENTDHDNEFSLGLVPDDEVAVIPLNKILYVRNLKVDGILRTLGTTIEV